ncbi:hypothetical protein GCM10029976_042920 [Kribbella albertanoniae]|uniref:SDR family oxidoreductase n=1 Tax=Kribbella albertanoniae TaxID=1266829 RepID=UPI001404840F|nr:NAD(P)H-binding protein [Kribbella albertanoniae]
MEEKIRVLVVGSTGTMGSSVLGALVAAGTPVRVLQRKPPPGPPVPSHVEVFTGDLRNSNDVRAAMTGISAAFYVSPHDDHEIDMAETFIQACERADVRLVFGGVHATGGVLSRRLKRLLFSAMMPH